MVNAAVRKAVRNGKKRTTSFKRFQSDRFKRVSESWRRPRGIDCRVRRKFKGTPLMPNIGYGTNKKLRHRLQSGHYSFLVKNRTDLELMVMQKKK